MTLSVRLLAALSAALLCSIAPLCADEPPVSLPTYPADVKPAMATFKSGDYKAAIPQLQAVADRPECAEAVRSALLSALVYEGRVDDATALANTLAVDFPNSAPSLTARGDFYYYMADFDQAEKLYRAALKQNEYARAEYGMFRLYRSASFYRTARILCMRAHTLDPEDSLITLAFIHYLVGEKRREMTGPFYASHPWFAAADSYDQAKSNGELLHQELTEHHAFEKVDNIKEADVPLIQLLSGPTRQRGVGIELAIGGGRPLRVLLDTGASGILLTSRAIDRAGLKHLGSSESWGIGDKGIQKGYLAVADTCRLGSLQYKLCVFSAIEGKGRIAGEDDGLVGMDFFSQYLIHLDFQRHTMHLTQLPERPLSPQGYDREIPPAEKDWVHMIRFGGHLYVPTLVNRKAMGLFLLDTGSMTSIMDSTFARLSTKIHSDAYMHIRGVSGSVKDVFEASKAELQFARFRQDNLGLTAIELNGVDRHQEFRMSGILGMPVLSLFRIDIDYRNALVNLDYIQR